MAMQALYGNKGLLIDGAIDPETDLETVFGTCPEYLEKSFENGIAEITNPDEKDFYAISISFNQYSMPVNTNISIVAKTGKRAMHIADVLENKLGMDRLNTPAYTF